MATSISIQDVIAETQLILEGSAVIASTVREVSSRAKKGSDSINLPTLAARAGQDVAVGDTLNNVNNNYGDDVLALDRVAADAFQIDSNDEEDNVLNGLSDGLRESLKSMAKSMDSNLYVKMLAAATNTEFVQTADFYADIVDLGKVMDIANVPYDERFLLVIPADYAKLLKTKDFVRFDGTGDASRINNGKVGEILGFTVIRAQLASVTETIGYHASGAVTAWHADSKVMKQPDALNMKDQYSAFRKFGTKALQAGAMIYKFAVTA